MPHPHDDEPFERKPSTRKARRPRAVEPIPRSHIVMMTVGALVMLALGLGLCWKTVVDLRRGWTGHGTEISYATADPAAFYITVLSLAAMGVFATAIGVQGLLGTFHETRPARPRPRRVSRPGTPRR